MGLSLFVLELRNLEIVLKVNVASTFVSILSLCCSRKSQLDVIASVVPLHTCAHACACRLYCLDL